MSKALERRIETLERALGEQRDRMKFTIAIVTAPPVGEGWKDCGCGYFIRVRD